MGKLFIFGGHMKKRGFSLIELMMGVFIVSATIVMICSLYTYLFKVSQKGVDLTAGTAVGEKVLEEFLEQNKDELILGTFIGSKKVNTSTFYYVIEVSGDSVGVSDYSLRKVDATIRWWDGGSTLGDKAMAKSTGTPTTSTDYDASYTNSHTGYTGGGFEDYTWGSDTVSNEEKQNMLEDDSRRAVYGYAHTKITKLVFSKS